MRTTLANHSSLIMRAFVFAVVVALWCAAPVVATGSCAVDGIDLSDLAGHDFTASTDEGQTFHVTPCGVSPQAACRSSDAAASVCALGVNGQPAVVYGEWTADSHLSSGDISATAVARLSSITRCGDDGRTWSSVVRFFCSTSTTAAASTPDCTVNIYIATPLACLPALRPQVSCQWSPDGATHFDFSSLQGGKDLTAVDENGSTYMLHLCDAIKSVSTCTDLDVYTGACVNKGGQVHVVGKWDNWQWAYMLPTVPQVGVQVTIAGDEMCGTKRSQSIIRLVCQRADGDLTVSFDEPSCTYSWTIPTPLSCPESVHRRSVASPVAAGLRRPNEKL